MNNITVYCHFTVVNSYIQCIHLHIPIDIDTCTYTLGVGGGIMLTREILLSFNKKTYSIYCLNPRFLVRIYIYTFV